MFSVGGDEVSCILIPHKGITFYNVLVNKHIKRC